MKELNIQVDDDDRLVDIKGTPGYERLNDERMDCLPYMRQPSSPQSYGQRIVLNHEL